MKVRTLWRLAWLVAIIIVCLVVSLGWPTAWHWLRHFLARWDSLGDWLVATGTLALAAGTFRLAKSTVAANATAAEALGLEQGRIRASQQPYVVPYGEVGWTQATDRERYMQNGMLPLKNVGPGSALNITGYIRGADGSVVATLAPTSLSPGNAEFVDIQWPTGAPGRSLSNVTGELQYDDISSVTYRTRFSISETRQITAGGVVQAPLAPADA